MKIIILVFSLASIMMGCSISYIGGQTPDDIYFSPVREEIGYVNIDRWSYRESNDRYLRMKATGSSRWRFFDDDFGYWNNPYWNNSAFLDFYPSFRGGMGFSPFMGNPFFGPTFGTGLYYNPFSPYYFGSPVVVFNNVKFTNPRANGPRIVNLNSYAQPQNYSSKYSNSNSRFGGSYINNGSNTPRGGYNPRGNAGSSSPSRTFSNSNSGSGFNNSSNSSSIKSNSGSSAPVRSFGRGGN
jgi:hypothetical protein